jgi:hypothetical protein
VVAALLVFVVTVAGLQPETQPTPSATAGEHWTAGTVVEPESVEEVPAALVRNADGFVLAVAREPGSERAIGILRLPPSDRDFLDESRTLELQIDDRPALSPTRLGGGLKSSTFFLWDGEGEPALGPLRDLMDASERVVVRYPLSGGGHKEIALGVAGVKEAIATVLAIAADVAPEARELARARQDAVEGCLAADKPKERDRCLERLAGCAEAATAEALTECLSAKR